MHNKIDMRPQPPPPSTLTSPVPGMAKLLKPLHLRHLYVEKAKLGKNIIWSKGFYSL
jgi:hypothetical protein